MNDGSVKLAYRRHDPPKRIAVSDGLYSFLDWRWYALFGLCLAMLTLALWATVLNWV